RGRSIRRHVRMASSEGRPSRRKNEPGIRPTAYIRSSKSTVRGKKSIPSRIDLLAVAVTSIWDPPSFAVTAPSACKASLPVEKVSSLPPTSPDTVISGTVVLLCCLGAARWQLSDLGEGWQLTTGLLRFIVGVERRFVIP